MKSHLKRTVKNSFRSLSLRQRAAHRLVSALDTCVCFARRRQPEQAAAETGVMDEAFYSVWTCNKFTLSSWDDRFAYYAARVTPVLLFVDLIWEHVQINVLQFTKRWSSGTPSGARWGDERMRFQLLHRLLFYQELCRHQILTACWIYRCSRR